MPHFMLGIRFVLHGMVESKLATNWWCNFPIAIAITIAILMRNRCCVCACKRCTFRIHAIFAQFLQKFAFFSPAHRLYMKSRHCCCCPHPLPPFLFLSRSPPPYHESQQNNRQVIGAIVFYACDCAFAVKLLRRICKCVRRYRKAYGDVMALMGRVCERCACTQGSAAPRCAWMSNSSFNNNHY